MEKIWAIWGAALAFFGVAFGAFGAHALKERLSADMLAIYEVAVRYQMYHALSLFVVAWATLTFRNPLLVWSGWSMVVGTLIFSGSLYILSLTGIRAWGAITPVGGLVLLLGWALLLWSFWKT